MSSIALALRDSRVCVDLWEHVLPGWMSRDERDENEKTLTERVDANGDMPDVACMSDARLTRQVHSNPESFLTLYNRYYDRILNYLYRRTMNVDLAEDLTSQTFLKALEFLKKNKRSVDFRPWIYRVATNVHVSHRRSFVRRMKRILLIGRFANDAAESPDCALSQKEEADRVRRELESLPDRYRLALMLRYDEELPHEEIAKILGIAASSARGRVSRGLAMLRKRLAQGGNHGNR